MDLTVILLPKLFACGFVHKFCLAMTQTYLQCQFYSKDNLDG